MRRRLTSLAALPIAIFRQGSTSCARGIFTFWRFLVLWTRFKRTILSYFEEIMPVCFHALDTERESCESVTCVTYPKSAATFSSTHFCQCSVSIEIEWPCPDLAPVALSLSLLFPLWQKKTRSRAIFTSAFFGMTHRIGWYACQSFIEGGAKAVAHRLRTGESAVHLMPQHVIWVNTHLYNNYVYFI